MKLNFAKKFVKNYKPSRYVVLQRVKKIEDDDIEANPKWRDLKDSYEYVEDSNADWIHYALQSLMNSILFHERIYFVLNRDVFRDEVLKKDPNWTKKKPVGFRNSKWKIFTEYLKNEEILRHYNEGKDEKIIWEVIDKELLSLLNIDREKQIKETQEYIQQSTDNLQNNDGDTDGDIIGDISGDIIGDIIGDITCLDEKQENDPFKNLNDYNDLDSGDIIGDIINAKSGTQKLEVREQRLDKKNNHVENESKNILNFNQLLVIQHPDSFPSFEDISYLAQLAVENCQDFQPDIMNLKIFEKHLLGQCKKPSPKQKDFISKLVKAFEFEANKFYNLKLAENIELKQPQDIKKQMLRQDIDNEEMSQEHTVSVLKATFFNDTLAVLKRKLENAETEERKMEIQTEINFLKRVN